MEERKPLEPAGSTYGFPVPETRFDQKMDMFKRARWDAKVLDLGNRFYKEIEFKDSLGWRQQEFAVTEAAWNVERCFAKGNARSNFGLYAWEQPGGKTEMIAKTGGRLQGDPQELTRMVKSVSLHFGAGLVGVCKVHPNWVYSHEFNPQTEEHHPFTLPDDCHTAVVIAIEMDYEMLASKSQVLGGAAVGLGYSKMAFVADLVATFIRGIGYRALPSGNDSALSVPLAMAAGLGEESRMGMLVTKMFGPRVRLCKVFTDMPLVPDSYAPFGVKEFCDTCTECARRCPSQAIPYGEPTAEGPDESNHSGPLKWYNDHKKCFSYWAKQRTDCSSCIQVCPFNKPPGALHDLVRALVARRSGPLNKLLKQMDRLAGYPKRFPIQDIMPAD